MEWNSSLDVTADPVKAVKEDESVNKITNGCSSDYAAYNPICPSPKSEERSKIMNKKFDRFIYFDNNATMPVLPVVQKKMDAVAKMIGNPSSDHDAGVKVRAYVEQARVNIAEHLGVDAKELIFTASGSESNNMILKGFIHKFAKSESGSDKDVILTTRYEHKSVQKTIEWLAETYSFRIAYVDLTPRGEVDLDKLRKTLDLFTEGEHPFAMVSIMGANNETGVVNQIYRISKMFKDLDEDIFFHTDMCQLLGKYNKPELAYVDAATFTAHKFGGPVGISTALIRGFDRIEPLIHGGNQESMMRAGTYNAPLIFGMSAAVMEINDNRYYKLKDIKCYLRDKLNENFDVTLRGVGTFTLCNTVSATFNLKGAMADVIVKELSERGIFVSTSSACNSHETTPSYVLKAIGLTDDEAYNTIRISLNFDSTKEEVDVFINELKKVIGNAS